MNDTITIFSIGLLITLCMVNAGLTLVQARRDTHSSESTNAFDWSSALTWTCAIGAAVIFLYRWLIIHDNISGSATWQPLAAHVDGLLLLAAMIAGLILYLQNRSRLPGAALFGLPVLAIVLLWALCAATFTFMPFEPATINDTVHRIAVYLGTAFLAIAAAAGGLYLLVQHRLKRMQTGGDMDKLKSLASLEKTETLIIRFSAIGFALLTIGFITGLIMITSREEYLSPGWWHSPKIILAVTAYLIYALVMNVRHATAFRGSRAAWLAIAGLVLLVATFGVVTALPAAPMLPPHTPHTLAPHTVSPAVTDSNNSTNNNVTPTSPSPTASVTDHDKGVE